MKEADRLFAGSIPQIYDEFLVPLIFTPYAKAVTERVAKLSPANILETAAGTGVVTRALAAKLPASVKITATDLNEPMLDRASSHLSGHGNITWRQTDAQALPFDDESFDAVVCQFGVMFYPDKAKGYSEARRVLRQGGTYIFTVWESLRHNHFVRNIFATVGRLFPDNPPDFMARIPHGYHDTGTIETALHTAGFQKVGIETIDHMATATSARIAATAYCQGTPIRSEIEAREPKGLERVTDAVTAELAKEFGDGTIEGLIRAHVISAVR